MYFIPLYFSSAEIKMKYLQEMYLELGFDSYLWGGLRRIQQGIYLFLIAKILIQNSPFGELKLIEKVALSFIYFFALIWFVDVSRYLFHFNLLGGIIDTVLLSVFILGLLYWMLVFSFSTSKYSKVTKYKAFELEPQLKYHYLEKIKQSMEQEKVYLNPKLSLKYLAKHLAIKTHHLSQVINQELHLSFPDLVNSYRIKEARRKLISPENKRLTIEAIAYETGFSSTSAFNAAFKKLTGTTPSKYRKNNNTLPIL